MDPGAPEHFDDPQEVQALLGAAGPRPALDEEDVAAVLASARRTWTLRRRQRRVRVVLALAAALGALAIGVAWWRWQAATPPPAPAFLAQVEAVRGTVEAGGRPIAIGDRVPRGATLQSGGLGRAALRLEGGAELRLDQETQVTLLAANALALERGSVYVDTGAGSRAAIAVHTPFGSARDIGTRFTVRVDAATRQLMVAVREGEVEIEPAGQVGQRHRAAPGEALAVGADGAVARHAAPTHGPAWGWVFVAAPAFAIEGRTLGEYLDWLQRETGWSIEFANPDQAAAARDILLHGDVSRMAPDRALEIVLAGAGFSSERRDGSISIEVESGGDPANGGA